MITPEPPLTLAAPLPDTTCAPTVEALPTRAALRWRSISWALIAGLSAGLIGLFFSLDLSVRSAGCGLFYGLLAFHLERVDPEDSHLQAGLVAALLVNTPASSKHPCWVAPAQRIRAVAAGMTSPHVWRHYPA